MDTYSIKWSFGVAVYRRHGVGEHNGVVGCPFHYWSVHVDFWLWSFVRTTGIVWDKDE